MPTENGPENGPENMYNGKKHILAPMVRGSEPAFRLLTRKYGSEWCFTPMWHSTKFTENLVYRKEMLNSLRQIDDFRDRPLTVQFCANEPEMFSECCSILYKEYPEVAVDLNLGCPQQIAKRGNYGSFLQEEPELIFKILKTAIDRNPETVITAKCRVLDTQVETLNYIDKLCSTGIKGITVHGRKRCMQGAGTGLADWKLMKECVEFLKNKYRVVLRICHKNGQK